ncbi:hypothetical protein ES705_44230 [subsurface metagenome]
MVKIKNVLGDVKIGRQGEVVYQRKHGEQIRRLASPKRAMASEAQIAHRQLYRDALAWRKALSLPNRRYLEGYCIANGVVDSYHIPLPWSRFALKLYLQAVKFIPKLTIEETLPVPAEKKDFNEEAYSTAFPISEAQWATQTFTPLQDYPIGKVILDGARHADPYTLTLGIRATDGEGKPTGDDLVSAQISTGIFPVFPSVDWKEITLPPYALSQGVKYAYVIRTPDAPYDHRFYLSYSDNDSHYPRGTFYYSPNSGVSWRPSKKDLRFQVWSEDIEGKYLKAGTLHVRHPALLAVVHKRGELTVREYDTLSSLDKEYLTGQVGLDVEAGDTIEATTLPGISYPFKVV